MSQSRGVSRILKKGGTNWNSAPLPLWAPLLTQPKIAKKVIFPYKLHKFGGARNQKKKGGAFPHVPPPPGYVPVSEGFHKVEIIVFNNPKLDMKFENIFECVMQA